MITSADSARILERLLEMAAEGGNPPALNLHQAVLLAHAAREAHELCDLVRRMRSAQRAYFRTRDGGVLHEACRLEKEVDSRVAAISPPEQTKIPIEVPAAPSRQPRAASCNAQGELFDE